MIDVFIIGSKGIPGRYGGYETFVDRLTEKHSNISEIRYHVACMNADKKRYEYNNSDCFNVKILNIGPAKAIFYDCFSLNKVIRIVKKENIKDFVVYILACRIGIFIRKYVKKIHKLGGKIYVNPDGHEWLRSKWSTPVKKYWKYSEKKMIEWCDLAICDSKAIEEYIRNEYRKYKPKTMYISYGANVQEKNKDNVNEKFLKWMDEKGLLAKDYYLIVGRFVPENNYETMIREFMLSKTTKKLVIITNENYKFMKKLKLDTEFVKDNRVKFVGTVYDKQLLIKIRENAYAYIHGHEVGGTNPSLLEALACTSLNLLLDVEFNKEVALDSALYWNKENGNLSNLIDCCDNFDDAKISRLSDLAKKRIIDDFSWDFISKKYYDLFLGEIK